MKSQVPERIADLRQEMAVRRLDALYLSGTDPHMSEYLSDHWQTRKFITGFSGSYGEVVITRHHAGLWTDTRYFLQAALELEGTGMTIHRLRVPDAIPVHEWLAENLPPGSRVGIDPNCLPLSVFRMFQPAFYEKKIELVPFPDMVDNLWENRPPLPVSPVYELDVSITGKSRHEKRTMISNMLNDLGADMAVISALDDLAWTYNLRGSDVPYNPLFFGFAMIGRDENRLFVSKGALTGELAVILQDEGIQVSEYENFYKYLSSVRNKTVYMDPATTNTRIWEALYQYCRLIEGTSVPNQLKSVKNGTELQGFREAMKQDGAAMVCFLRWLSSALGKTRITEYTIGRKLVEFRSARPGFIGESFSPAIGYNDHGALVHLQVTRANAYEIRPGGILLIDSGGHYLTGTTDITRTIALGTPTLQQKTDFTLALKGMIGLSTAQFPAGTKGIHLDILARLPLWKKGLNYGHGTGHGVGHFLNVHEGPAAIRHEYNPYEIKPGMVLSNEPGIYREGQYGVRTENLMVCVEKRMTEYGRFLGFETLTLCPVDPSLVNLRLMSEAEIAWLNDYHLQVRKGLEPLLDDEQTDFLHALTKPVG
jgi:Xaa-Pro aminopeptidase